MIVNLHDSKQIRMIAPELDAERAREIWYGGGVHTSRAGIEILCRPWAGWWRCLARGTRPTLAPRTGGAPAARRSAEGLPRWAPLRAEVWSRTPRGRGAEALLAPWRACAAAVGARVLVLRAGEGGAELLHDLPLPARVDMLAIERLPGGGSIAPLRCAQPHPAPVLPLCGLVCQLLAREVRGDWVIFLPSAED